MVSKSNRHRFVGAGRLLAALCRHIKGVAVSLTRVEASKSWPRVIFPSCRGACQACQHSALDNHLWAVKTCDKFRPACSAKRSQRTACILILQPAAARQGNVCLPRPACITGFVARRMSQHRHLRRPTQARTIGHSSSKLERRFMQRRVDWVGRASAVRSMSLSGLLIPPLLLTSLLQRMAAWRR